MGGGNVGGSLGRSLWSKLFRNLAVRREEMWGEGEVRFGFFR